MTEEKVVKKKAKTVDTKRVPKDSPFYVLWSGEALKAEAGIKQNGNRFDRRKRIRQSLTEILRDAKRVDRVIMLKDIAQQIRTWYPDISDDIKKQIKKWYKKDHKEVIERAGDFIYKPFARVTKWKEIEAEMIKLLSRKGETNNMPKKKRRK